jgi:hypothetical protein
VDGPAPAGIVANNVPRFRKLQGSHTFRSWQAGADQLRAARRRFPTARRDCGTAVEAQSIPVPVRPVR